MALASLPVIAGSVEPDAGQSRPVAVKFQLSGPPAVLPHSRMKLDRDQGAITYAFGVGTCLEYAARIAISMSYKLVPQKEPNQVSA